MLRKFLLRHSERFLSRWLVYLGDILIVLLAYQSAVLLRFNFELPSVPDDLIWQKLPLIILAYAAGGLIARSHVGVIRHTSLTDAYAVFKAAVIGMALVWLSSTLSLLSPSRSEWFWLPNSVILIHFLLNLFLLIGSRLTVKVLYHRLRNKEKKSTRVLIYGAGASGIITKNTLLHDTSREFEVIGFLDDNPSKIGKKIEGVSIYSREKALKKAFLDKNKVHQLIISIQDDLSPKKRALVIEECLNQGLQVKVVPPVSRWIHGELSSKQIKPVRIEDLLERSPIKLDSDNVARELKGKVILVSGAAGSIGSEIARQVLHYQPAKVILLDQAESALYEMEYELKTKLSHLKHLSECVIADVRNHRRMQHVFETFKPDVVFHAAAYKHVPLMEDNPYEAMGVNVLGTQVMADLACYFKVEKFVLVSTDKAVNPTNVMGATKRTAEIYVQSLNNEPDHTTQFITTRFGNVLGSNGSVIPIFRKQIQSGGPITITHRDITRYFMTIPEACNLVLEAGAMGKGGEIFVFDMGKSVKIYDLAKKMVRLSGLTLGKDIEIREVGLRPGEKLYEELLSTSENTIGTHHPKIMIAKTRLQDFDQVRSAFDRMRTQHNSCDNMAMVKNLKEIVPEFISNNSVYGKLDQKRGGGQVRKLV